MQKYKHFAARAVRLLVIVAALLFYQNAMELKVANAQLRASEKESEQTKEQIKELNTQIEDLAAKEAEEEQTEGADNEKDAAAESEEDSQGQYQDGTYQGEGTGFGGTIQVEVVVEQGAITAVNILEASGEDTAYLDMAKAITDSIVESQSAEVDTVSGATFSSNGILEAVSNALDKAVK